MLMTEMPLVCTATLDSLEESLDGERTLCQTFVCRYVEMWPGRFERIRAAVTNGHEEDAMDSALSLRSSSMMVGAARLGELITDVIALLSSGDTALAASKLPELQKCGHQTAHHLTVSYLNVA